MAKKKNNYIIVITSIVLVLCIAASVIGGLSKGFTDWDAKNWGKQAVNGGTTNPLPDDNSGLVVGDLISNGMFLAATAAESGGITLTATITPESAVDKTVTWSFAWADTAVTDDVTQFISVTPSFEGSLTATVDCLQAFGNQIKIRVESNANPAAYAEITVDYAKRVSRTNVTTTGKTVTWNFNADAVAIDLEAMKSFYRESTLGDNGLSDGQSFVTAQTKGTGTVDTVTVSGITYQIKASAELVAAYAGAASSYVELYDVRQFEMLRKVFNTDMYSYRFDGLLPKNVGYYLTSEWNNIVSALNGLTGHAFELKIITETSLGTIENVVNITINKASIGAQASSVSVSQSNIVF